MTEKLKEKDVDQIINAMIRMREDEFKRLQKAESKLWTPIDPAISLTDALARLTKDELSAIRVRLDIKGASSLKKADLIERLEAAMLQDLTPLLQSFDEKRYSVVKELADHNGCIAADKRKKETADSLRELGIVFTGSVNGKDSLIMPAELLKAFREADTSDLSDTVKRNAEWCLLTNGMLLYYGSLRFQDLSRLLTKYTGAAAAGPDVVRVLTQNIDSYWYRMDHNGFSNLDAEDSDSVLNEHDMRHSVEYYPFTKAQLLRAGEAGFIERNEAYKTFVAFLAAYFDMNREEAFEFTDDCVTNIQAGDSMQDVIAFLDEHLELDENSLRMLVDRLVPLINGTRQWALKGYSPTELSAKRSIAPLAAPARTAAGSKVVSIQQKVGRNEPCPCGSGKKYKKCCGA